VGIKKTAAWLAGSGPDPGHFPEGATAPFVAVEYVDGGDGPPHALRRLEGRMKKLRMNQHAEVAGARRGLVGLATCVAAGLSACGGLHTPEEVPRPTLFSVQGQVTGTLEDDTAGELRAALAWSVYSDELISCVDAIEIDGPINWASEEDDAIIAGLQRCLHFSERGRSETASVPLSPSFPSSFTIPVDSLPDASLLSGGDDARLGIAGVLIYSDDNDNQRFDETPLGADAFIDVVRGTSFPLSDDATEVSYVIYREGTLSPIWKLFEALYGCAEPALGFSTLTVNIDSTFGEATCVLDDRALTVALSPSIGRLGCAEDPVRDDYIRPTSQGLDAGSAAICDDFGDLLVTEQAQSVCPSFRRYALVGCSDLSSEDACRETFWDLTASPPGWWPCNGFNPQPRLRILDAAFATDDVDDQLFSLQFSDGLLQLDEDDLEVAVVVGGEAIVLSATVVDNDNNGVFNVGDVLRVGESDENEFTTAFVPGAYPIRVRGGDVELEVFGVYQPVAVAEPALISISAVDADDVISDGIDDIAIVTYEGDGVGHPFSALSATYLIGGELPISVSVAGGGVVVALDQDGDGLFEPGDAIMIRDENTETWGGMSLEALNTFGGILYISLAVEVGEGLRQFLAHDGFVEVQ
jgi:hypothetical protein